YRVTRTLVFPVPAEASSMTFCSGSTANALAAASGSMTRGSMPEVRGLSTSNNDGCSLIAHVVLPADGGVCAPVAEKRLIRSQGKVSALDRVDGGQQPRLALRERLLHARKLAEGVLILERNVGRAANRPGTAVPSLERLLR